FPKMGVIPSFNRVHYFISFLKGGGSNGFGGLFEIPRTAMSGIAEALHEKQQVVEGVRRALFAHKKSHSLLWQDQLLRLTEDTLGSRLRRASTRLRSLKLDTSMRKDMSTVFLFLL